MYFVLLLIVGALLFLVASFVFGRGEQLAPMPPDVSPLTLPAARRVTAADVDGLRLSVVVRGYRMSEVDWLLERLATQLDERDQEIATLRDQLGTAAGAAAGPAGDAAADSATDTATADTGVAATATATATDSAVDTGVAPEVDSGATGGVNASAPGQESRP